jgi:hypothetical protein
LCGHPTVLQPPASWGGSAQVSAQWARAKVTHDVKHPEGRVIPRIGVRTQAASFPSSFTAFSKLRTSFRK